MPLPQSSEAVGLAADSTYAPAVAGDEVVYRLLRGAEPGRKDFVSDREGNRPYVSLEPWIEHAGISVFDVADVAVSITQRFPAYVAELRLPAAAGCSIAKTGGPHHFTVWGSSETLLAAVTRRLRQTDPDRDLTVVS